MLQYSIFYIGIACSKDQYVSTSLYYVTFQFNVERVECKNNKLLTEDKGSRKIRRKQ